MSIEKKRLIILPIETTVIVLLTFLPKIIAACGGTTFPGFNIIVYLLIAISACLAIRLSEVKIDFEWKNYKQYLIGAGVALFLSLCIAWIPALCGSSIVGEHTNFDIAEFFINLFFFMLIVGPVEELVFRIYYQKVLVIFLKNIRIVAVLLASLIFGLWHWINGSLFQVLFTFGIGFVFGVVKEYVKDMHYPGISLSHGLYDFLNYIVRLTVV